MLGLEVVIDWPTPPMRERGLAIETYLPLDPYLPADRNPNRWINGVTWTPYGCPDTTSKRLDNECIDAYNAFVNPTAFDSEVTFRGFRIETAFECSTLGGMGINGEELQKRALEVTRQDRSRQLARQVMFGVPETPNMDLTDQADDVTAQADFTPVGALAAVERGLAERLNNARGMIHVDPGMLVLLNSGGGLVVSGTEIQTITGNIVVADAGYLGAGGQAGQSHIFGSGMVYYKTSALQPVSSSWENFDWERNVVEAQVEQYALAAFEPCGVVRARADLD